MPLHCHSARLMRTSLAQPRGHLASLHYRLTGASEIGISKCVVDRAVRFCCKIDGRVGVVERGRKYMGTQFVVCYRRRLVIPDNAALLYLYVVYWRISDLHSAFALLALVCELFCFKGRTPLWRGARRSACCSFPLYYSVSSSLVVSYALFHLFPV